MNEVFYTHAMWRVLPGREAEFITTWMTLADVFGRLPDPPVGGGQLRVGILIAPFDQSDGPMDIIKVSNRLRGRGQPSLPFCR